jgi:hypothetical protein
MAFMVLDSQAATSVSNLACCLCVSIDRATVLLAAIYEISRLYGGSVSMACGRHDDI